MDRKTYDPEQRQDQKSLRGPVRKMLVSDPELGVITPSLADHEDDDRTPVNPPALEEELRREREHITGLGNEIAHYFRDVPDSLTIPAAFFLAKETAEYIASLEDVYRHLDTKLKDILRKYVPNIELPSFDELLVGGVASGKLVAQMHGDVKRYFSWLLPNHLFSEVQGQLSLYAAFADNLANAKYLQTMPREDSNDVRS
jgi:hypothetical protein